MVAVIAMSRCFVLIAFGCWVNGRQVQNDSDFGFSIAQILEDLNSQAVREQKVVSNLQSDFSVFDAGCMMSPCISYPCCLLYTSDAADE